MDEILLLREVRKCPHGDYKGTASRHMSRAAERERDGESMSERARKRRASETKRGSGNDDELEIGLGLVGVVGRVV